MFKKLLLGITFITCLPSMAGASPFCEYYGGHFDLEAKLGERNMGEASVFMPLSCSQTDLLFTDLRFKIDEYDTNEGNFGLGFRTLRETGVLGGYLFFDRKQSGLTEKIHTQLTAGADWLTESYEGRANFYLPITGEKQAYKPLSTPIASSPFLAGSGIFISRTNGRIITEEPLWGADAEAGFKIPDTRFWLHAGGFSFHGEDTGNLTGARTSARYYITDNLSVSAEGQYDNIRGRTGWLGARISIPFGGPAEKATGLKSRMTASPVRDVDIVTSIKAIQAAPSQTVAVKNTQTQDDQRVLYVNNAAAVNGDGTKENPFNNLASAQTALKEQDIVYIHSNTVNTGMDQGFTIDKEGVSVIGAGSAFAYDNNKFYALNDSSLNGTILIAAGTAPTITNINPYVGGNTTSSSGVLITASNVNISGVNVNGVNGSGFYVMGDGKKTENVTITNTQSTGNGRHGYIIQSANAGGAIDNITLTNTKTSGNGLQGVIIQANGSNTEVNNVTINTLETNNNAERGVYIQATNTGIVKTINLNKVNAHHNTMVGVMIQNSHANSSVQTVNLNDIQSDSNQQQGLYVQLTAGSVGTVNINKLQATNNQSSGLHFQTAGESFIDSIIMDDATSTGNALHGLYLFSNNTGGQIKNATITNSKFNTNTQNGVLIATGNTAAPLFSSIKASLQNTVVSANQRDGIYINHDSTTGVMNVDLGGGGSSLGNNSLYGNGTSNTTTYRDIKLDTNNGAAVPAQNNWWGQAGGPTGTQIIGEGAAPNTGTADTTSPQGSDPNTP